jgi:3-hydroxyacyl-CoA dehydrogenase
MSDAAPKPDQTTPDRTTPHQTAPVQTMLSSRVAVITIDNPPVNALSQAVRAGLQAALRAAEASGQVDAVVIACAGRTFIAGADIGEFGRPPQPPFLPDLCGEIEACEKPVVAALHGTALGGGAEVALACHARIAARDTRLGFPEVKLGLIPGAGGTQRLPRLTGIAFAAQAIASGRMIGADEALKAGLIDAVSDGPARDAAVGHARALAAELQGRPPRRTGARAAPQLTRDEAETLIAEVDARARGQIAPGRAARAVLDAGRMSLAEGLERERAAFRELVAGEQSAALRHIFFAERAAAKVPGLESARARPVRQVGVVGSGTMGVGIAVATASAGLPVVVVESDGAALARGRLKIDEMLRKAVALGRITQAAEVTYSLGPAPVAGCDLVIEAVFDDLAVKHALFQSLSAVCRPDAVLATNTSYLDPGAIAEAASHPERVVGLHFFSPAQVMRLVEVIPTPATAPDVTATAFAFARALKKLPVWARPGEGFIGNRIFSAYRKQCEYMLEDGALPHEIDAAMEAFGLPMGPFAVFDLAGLDIAWARRKRIAGARDPAERYSRIADQLCEKGRFGQKSGAGWYSYVEGPRRVDPSVTALIEAESAARGVTRRKIGAEEIRLRIIAAMVNEGAKVLTEGVALRASDIDLVFVNGYGWPGWRGGPMFQAGRLGLPRILAEVEAMRARDGAGWEPAPLLAALAAAGRDFGA